MLPQFLAKMSRFLSSYIAKFKCAQISQCKGGTYVCVRVPTYVYLRVSELAALLREHLLCLDSHFQGTYTQRKQTMPPGAIFFITFNAQSASRRRPGRARRHRSRVPRLLLKSDRNVKICFRKLTSNSEMFQNVHTVCSEN